MSKKAKSAAKEKRKMMKRARREQNRAKYRAFVEAGTNSKSDRSRKQLQAKKTVNNVSHPDGACGNIGCKRCSPIYQPGGPLYRAPEVSGEVRA